MLLLLGRQQPGGSFLSRRHGRHRPRLGLAVGVVLGGGRRTRLLHLPDHPRGARHVLRELVALRQDFLDLRLRGDVPLPLFLLQLLLGRLALLPHALRPQVADHADACVEQVLVDVLGDRSPVQVVESGAFPQHLLLAGTDAPRQRPDLVPLGVQHLLERRVRVARAPQLLEPLVDLADEPRLLRLLRILAAGRAAAAVLLSPRRGLLLRGYQGLLAGKLPRFEALEGHPLKVRDLGGAPFRRLHCLRLPGTEAKEGRIVGAAVAGVLVGALRGLPRLHGVELPHLALRLVGAVGHGLVDIFQSFHPLPCLQPVQHFFYRLPFGALICHVLVILRRALTNRGG
mmetsp:Transcript_14602/g.41733  ORF Transcript_14602/g.41733 Transcript_14602/m.41733 type:complete len:343 (+) Transcript_14602:1147-2175(+)